MLLFEIKFIYLNAAFQGQASDQLQEVDVPIQDIEKCKRNYASKVSYEIDNKGSMVCAGYDEGGKDACQGMFC